MKFLNKQTLNAKVNNWAVELEQYKLKLDWISGSKNLVADSLSRLMDVVPDAHEFGSYCFEELKPAEVLESKIIEKIYLEESICDAETKEGDDHSTPPRKKHQEQPREMRVTSTRYPHRVAMQRYPTSEMLIHQIHRVTSSRHHLHHQG